jgi:hypothetical protein
MKRQSPTQAKNELKLSDAILAKRYLELQRLRDEVHKAEISRATDARSPRGPSGLHYIGIEESQEDSAERRLT